MIFRAGQSPKLRNKFNAFVMLAAFALAAAPDPAAAQEQTRHHALSLMGAPKYPADFAHFDYVNPAAPKGGSVRLPDIGSFDSLNPISFKGVGANGLGLIYESLMYDSIEEQSTSYGLIAEWASYPDDFSSVTFKLRDEARWHDGQPITPEDVIFSLEMMKKVNPRMAFYYKNIAKAEKTGEREVTFTFDVKGNRELPMITGQLTVLPKHYWTSKDADGETRDLAKTTMEAPLGSGPYKIKDVKPGRSITYERVADYWGKDLPVNIGHYNFDEIRYDTYLDSTVSFEAFKGDQLDFYRETSSKNWATAYEFKAMKEGKVKKQLVRLDTGQPMQAFVFNTRRDKFSDPRVRRAFNHAFDFEWANENLFYGQYERVSSYFENSELAARGLPEGQELEILNTVKDQVPPEVFTTEFKNPTNTSRDALRDNLKTARTLLEEAGWKIVSEEKMDENCGWWCSILHAVGLKSRKIEPVLRNDKGESMEVEFLLISPAFERIVQPFLRNLERLGIKGTIRLVDAAQYKRRLDGFDFDIIVHSFSQSSSPGNEQRYFWGSKAADENGSQNMIGIKDKAIDALIDKVIFAKDRPELVAATRALDRVLLWNHFVVPQWFSPNERIAYWTRFGQPKTLPALGVAFTSVWWWDEKEAAKFSSASR